MPEIDVQKQIEQLGSEIVDSFKAKLGDLKLTAEEAALVQRVSERLAYVAVHLPGASDETKQTLALQRDAALATLQNLSVAKAMEAEKLMRQAVYESVLKALKMGLGLALTVIAA